MFNFVEVMVAKDAGVLDCLDTGNQHLLSQVQAEVTLYCLCWPPGLKDTQQYWEALQLMLVWIILNLFLSWILCQKRVQCDKITHGWRFKTPRPTRNTTAMKFTTWSSHDGSLGKCFIPPVFVLDIFELGPFDMMAKPASAIASVAGCTRPWRDCHVD